MMTPYEIGILLHYFGCAADPHEEKIDMRAPAWRHTVDGFMAMQLLELDGSDLPRTYKLTERGRVYVEDGLMKVLLPVQSWHIPKDQ